MQIELFFDVLIPAKAPLEEVHPHHGQDEHAKQQHLRQEHQEVEEAGPASAHVPAAPIGLVTAPEKFFLGSVWVYFLGAFYLKFKDNGMNFFFWGILFLRKLYLKNFNI